MMITLHLIISKFLPARSASESRYVTTGRGVALEPSLKRGVSVFSKSAVSILGRAAGEGGVRGTGWGA